jgi:hypothetical protein
MWDVGFDWQSWTRDYCCISLNFPWCMKYLFYNCNWTVRCSTSPHYKKKWPATANLGYPEPRSAGQVTPFVSASRRNWRNDRDETPPMKSSFLLKRTLYLHNRAPQIKRHFSMAFTQKIEDGAWHGLIQPDGEFPPEKGRYHLYIGRWILA